MSAARQSKQSLIEKITETLMRQHSTAAVLLHHAVAERLGLGPTDHKCLDLLRERGAMTGSDLAAITGLTTGAITGVVARLEQAGYLRREPDPQDGRKQTLHPLRERAREIHVLFEPIRRDMSSLLNAFDDQQLTAIAEFLARSTDLIHRHVVLLRSQSITAGWTPERIHIDTASKDQRMNQRHPVFPTRRGSGIHSALSMRAKDRKRGGRR